MSKKLSDICIQARNEIGRGIPSDAVTGAVLLNIIELNKNIEKLLELQQLQNTLIQNLIDKKENDKTENNNVKNIVKKNTKSGDE